MSNLKEKETFRSLNFSAELYFYLEPYFIKGLIRHYGKHSISYLCRAIEDETKIAYLTYERHEKMLKKGLAKEIAGFLCGESNTPEIQKTHYYMGKPGRVFKKLFGDSISEEEIKELAQRFISYSKDTIEVSDDIHQIYYGQSSDLSGTIGSSCMRGTYCGMWYENLNKYMEESRVRIAVIERDEIVVARALIWENILLETPDGKVKKVNYLDRVYLENENDISTYKKWAEENNFLYRKSLIGCRQDLTEIVFQNENKVVPVKLRIKLPFSKDIFVKKNSTLKFFVPYMDTFYAYFPDNGILTNCIENSSNWYYELTTTNGSYYEYNKKVECSSCGEIVSESDILSVEEKITSRREITKKMCRKCYNKYLMTHFYCSTCRRHLKLSEKNSFEYYVLPSIKIKPETRVAEMCSHCIESTFKKCSICDRFYMESSFRRVIYKDTTYQICPHCYLLRYTNFKSCGCHKYLMDENELIMVSAKSQFGSNRTDYNFHVCNKVVDCTLKDLRYYCSKCNKIFSVSSFKEFEVGLLGKILCSKCAKIITTRKEFFNSVSTKKLNLLNNIFESDLPELDYDSVENVISMNEFLIRHGHLEELIPTKIFNNAVVSILVVDGKNTKVVCVDLFTESPFMKVEK